MLVTIWMWTHEWSVSPRRCGVDAGHVPPRLDLQVAVDRVQQLIEAPVAARGRADVDVGQRAVGGWHSPQPGGASGAPRRPRRRRPRPSTRRSAGPSRRGPGRPSPRRPRRASPRRTSPRRSRAGRCRRCSRRRTPPRPTARGRCDRAHARRRRAAQRAGRAVHERAEEHLPALDRARARLALPGDVRGAAAAAHAPGHHREGDGESADRATGHACCNAGAAANLRSASGALPRRPRCPRPRAPGGRA